MRSVMGRFLGIILALGIAAVSVACNVKFGLHFGDGLTGQIYAALFGLVDLLKALLPLMVVAALVVGQYLRVVCGMTMFAAFTAVSLTSAAGLYSLTKAEAVADVEAGRASYDLAKDELDRTRNRLAALGGARPVGAVRGDIEAAKQHRRWRTTRACTNATVPASREFCDGFKRLEGELATAQEAAALRSRATELAAKIDGMNLNEVMRAADPQAEALARLSGFTADEIRSALAVLVALVVELGSGLGLWMAVGGHHAPRPKRVTPDDSCPQLRALPSVPSVPEPMPVRRPVLAVAPMPEDCAVSMFATECIERRKRATVPAQDLYQAYKTWASEAGAEVLNLVAFGRALTALGLTKKKVGGYVHYCNIRLADEPQEGRLGPMATGLFERAEAMH